MEKIDPLDEKLMLQYAINNYPKGSKYYYNDTIKEVKGSFYYHYNNNNPFITDSYGGCVYDKGKWSIAEPLTHDQRVERAKNIIYG